MASLSSGPCPFITCTDRCSDSNPRAPSHWLHQLGTPRSALSLSLPFSFLSGPSSTDSSSHRLRYLSRGTYRAQISCDPITLMEPNPFPAPCLWRLQACLQPGGMKVLAQLPSLGKLLSYLGSQVGLEGADFRAWPVSVLRLEAPRDGALLLPSDLRVEPCL